MIINFTEFHQYKEGNRLEVKKAAGGLPQSLWQTYSASANTDGGVILLGVDENADKALKLIGIENPDKLIIDFWNTPIFSSIIKNTLTQVCVGRTGSRQPPANGVETCSNSIARPTTSLYKIQA